MKKVLKILLTSLLAISILFAIVGCNDNKEQKTTEQFRVQLASSISLNSQKEYISPLIYGQFIEHIDTCIYNGIWSEIVLDRKFYYEVGDSGLSPWKATGNKEVVSQTEHTYSGAHAPLIKAGSGITQNKLTFEKEEYVGYFYCKSDSGCTVKITIAKGVDKFSESITVAKNSDFTKYEYALTSEMFTLDGASFTLEVESGEGIFDSLSLMPANNYHGMRMDTLEKLKELNSPMYRWPGGNFLSGYDWKDGVGDIDKREPKRNLHYMGLESSFESEADMIASDMVNINSLGFYGAIEPNDYGLDEFMLMCDYLNTEVLMMVNNGLGSLEDAVDQVEYCNGSASTEFGALRAQNGHSEPYDIKYWGIGNEMFGDWQLGNVPISEYVVRHNNFATAMKQKDSDIYIVAVGANNGTWSSDMFKNCAGNFDYIAEHMYAKQDNNDVFAHLNNMRSNLNGRITNHRKLIARYPNCSNVKIAFTEYAYENAFCPSRLKDGLGIGVFLNTVIDNADVFEMCHYSSTVNATQGCVTTNDYEARLQGAGYVLKLYHDYMQDYAIEATVKHNDALQLDVSASISKDGKTLTVSVVNPSEFSVQLNNAIFTNAKRIDRHTFTGAYCDSYSTPSEEIYYEDMLNVANVVAPMQSVSVFVIQLQELYEK